MEIITVHQSDMGEACPQASLEGFHVPNENQFQHLIAHDAQGRLNPSLRGSSIVTWGDAVRTLASAAIFQLVLDRHATVPFGFGGADNPDLASAIADLAVVGEGNYASLVEACRFDLDGTVITSIPLLKASVAERLTESATLLGVALDVAVDSPEANAAIDSVVERALRVAWALNGPVQHRAEARAELGWIAANSERDQPRRPVNIPATHWPTADTQVTVETASGPITCRTRYAIAGAVDADTGADILNALPNTTQPPRIDPEADIFIFLHGHSSRLEEAGSLFEPMREQAAKAFYPKPIAMVSFDFPSNGYSPRTG